MKPYKVSAKKITGRSYSDVERTARKLHKQIVARTKRNPYVRSAYFKNKNSKVFINLFWQHLNQKPEHDRKRRLKFYACAIDLIRHTHFEPASKENLNKSGEILHRFAGLSADNELFYVQIKEVKRTGNKYFMSVFPPN